MWSPVSPLFGYNGPQPYGRPDLAERSAAADARDKDAHDGDGSERCSADESAADSDRRDFLTTASGIGMAAGLAASYGTFAVMAGRFLYPTDRGTAWMFVVETRAVSPGGSFRTGRRPEYRSSSPAVPTARQMSNRRRLIFLRSQAPARTSAVVCIGSRTTSGSSAPVTTARSIPKERRSPARRSRTINVCQSIP